MFLKNFFVALYYCSICLPSARFYKKTNSKQKATLIDNYRCAADCLQDPKCKGFSTQRDVYPQCVTHGEEIFNISESSSIDSWVKGKCGNCLPFKMKHLGS